MSEDAVKVAPHVYKVLAETAKVRVLEARMKAGAKTDLHKHPAHVGVAITAGKYRFAGADGKTMDAALEPGQVIVLEATEHTTENVGDNELVAIIVEVK